MASAKLTSKGQITIPKAVREALKVETGDRIGFRIREDGVIEIHPETLDLMSLAGVIKPSRTGVSIEDMERAIGEGASQG